MYPNNPIEPYFPRPDLPGQHMSGQPVNNTQQGVAYPSYAATYPNYAMHQQLVNRGSSGPHTNQQGFQPVHMQNLPCQQPPVAYSNVIGQGNMPSQHGVVPYSAGTPQPQPTQSQTGHSESNWQQSQQAQQPYPHVPNAVPPHFENRASSNQGIAIQASYSGPSPPINNNQYGRFDYNWNQSPHHQFSHVAGTAHHPHSSNQPNSVQAPFNGPAVPPIQNQHGQVDSNWKQAPQQQFSQVATTTPPSFQVSGTSNQYLNQGAVHNFSSMQPAASAQNGVQQNRQQYGFQNQQNEFQSQYNVQPRPHSENPVVRPEFNWQPIQRSFSHYPDTSSRSVEFSGVPNQQTAFRNSSSGPPVQSSQSHADRPELYGQQIHPASSHHPHTAPPSVEFPGFPNQQFAVQNLSSGPPVQPSQTYFGRQEFNGQQFHQSFPHHPQTTTPRSVESPGYPNQQVAAQNLSSGPLVQPSYFGRQEFNGQQFNQSFSHHPQTTTPQAVESTVYPNQQFVAHNSSGGPPVQPSQTQMGHPESNGQRFHQAFSYHSHTTTSQSVESSGYLNQQLAVQNVSSGPPVQPSQTHVDHPDFNGQQFHQAFSHHHNTALQSNESSGFPNHQFVAQNSSSGAPVQPNQTHVGRPEFIVQQTHQAFPPHSHTTTPQSVEPPGYPNQQLAVQNMSSGLPVQHSQNHVGHPEFNGQLIHQVFSHDPNTTPPSVECSSYPNQQSAAQNLSSGPPVQPSQTPEFNGQQIHQNVLHHPNTTLPSVEYFSAPNQQFAVQNSSSGPPVQLSQTQYSHAEINTAEPHQSQFPQVVQTTQPPLQVCVGSNANSLPANCPNCLYPVNMPQPTRHCSTTRNNLESRKKSILPEVLSVLNLDGVTSGSDEKINMEEHSKKQGDGAAENLSRSKSSDQPNRKDSDVSAVVKSQHHQEAVAVLEKNSEEKRESAMNAKNRKTPEKLSTGKSEVDRKNERTGSVATAKSSTNVNREDDVAGSRKTTRAMKRDGRRSLNEPVSKKEKGVEAQDHAGTSESFIPIEVEKSVKPDTLQNGSEKDTVPVVVRGSEEGQCSTTTEEIATKPENLSNKDSVVGGKKENKNEKWTRVVNKKSRFVSEEPVRKTNRGVAAKEPLNQTDNQLAILSKGDNRIKPQKLKIGSDKGTGPVSSRGSEKAQGLTTTVEVAKQSESLSAKKSEVRRKDDENKKVTPSAEKDDHCSLDKSVSRIESDAQGSSKQTETFVEAANSESHVLKTCSDKDTNQGSSKTAEKSTKSVDTVKGSEKSEESGRKRSAKGKTSKAKKNSKVCKKEPTISNDDFEYELTEPERFFAENIRLSHVFGEIEIPLNVLKKGAADAASNKLLSRDQLLMVLLHNSKYEDEVFKERKMTEMKTRDEAAMSRELDRSALKFDFLHIRLTQQEKLCQWHLTTVLFDIVLRMKNSRSETILPMCDTCFILGRNTPGLQNLRRNISDLFEELMVQYNQNEKLHNIVKWFNSKVAELDELHPEGIAPSITTGAELWVRERTLLAFLRRPREKCRIHGAASLGVAKFAGLTTPIMELLICPACIADAAAGKTRGVSSRAWLTIAFLAFAKAEVNCMADLAYLNENNDFIRNLNNKTRTMILNSFGCCKVDDSQAAKFLL